MESTSCILDTVQPNVHTLNNGATVIVLIHGECFKFNDKTWCSAQKKEILDEFELLLKHHIVLNIKDMPVFKSYLFLPYEKIDVLKRIASMANIVIVSKPLIDCLYRLGIRSKFPNVVIAQPTYVTRYYPNEDKIIDIMNWSY